VNSHHSDLIDTTEMYLRTIYELEEEGVTPLRARIAERLSQSGPTVSQTVARMERDGLVHVESDRHLQLTEAGRHHATAVMRKHRLAERLLQDVIGLEWDQLHIEACRWEHVMSDAVERRILALLDKPLVCPHGNPIPGLEELGLPFGGNEDSALLPTLASVAGTGDKVEVTVQRISEQLQPDAKLMRQLSAGGIVPGRTVTVTRTPAGWEVSGGPETSVLSPAAADGIFVAAPSGHAAPSGNAAPSEHAAPLAHAAPSEHAAPSANSAAVSPLPVR
jgi:DtxR family Mn-dependent transcriptional regulator